MIKKIFSVIVCMLLITIILPINVTADETSGNTIYVDDDGGADYTRIQDAIDNASDGDTVFVYGGIYYENVIIHKIIDLIGEDKYETVIDSNHEESVLKITVDGVTVHGFTLQNTGLYELFAGVEIRSSNNKISDTLVKNTNRGIILYGSDKNIIDNNIITDVTTGIDVHFESHNNTISNNTIEKNDYSGIGISNSKNNVVTRNIINGIGGLDIYWANNNDIFLNTITGVKYFHVILIQQSSNNTIYRNNFINNRRNSVLMSDSFNTWDENYWGRIRILPKPIIGIKYVDDLRSIPYISFDWHPAQEPYEI
jgi:parallel beta-helix repeat protein